MKTLSEEINEIKNAKISKTAKRTALAKLGLLKSDVEIVMSSMPAPEARGSRFAYTFGVEIECYNVDRDLMHQSADANALRIAYEGYNHRDNTEYYKFVRDGSIVGDNGIECVSPVLDSRTGFASLEACCKTTIFGVAPSSTTYRGNSTAADTTRSMPRRTKSTRPSNFASTRVRQTLKRLVIGFAFARNWSAGQSVSPLIRRLHR